MVLRTEMRKIRKGGTHIPLNRRKKARMGEDL